MSRPSSTYPDPTTAAPEAEYEPRQVARRGPVCGQDEAICVDAADLGTAKAIACGSRAASSLRPLCRSLSSEI